MAPLTNGLFRVAHLVCLPLLLLLVLGESLARSLFGTSMPWTGEAGSLTLLLLLTCALPRASLPENNDPIGRHLSMSFLYDRLSPNGQRRLCVLGVFSGAIVSAAIVTASIQDTIERVTYREQSELLGLPLWPAASLVGLCAAVMLVQYLLILPGLLRKGEQT